MTKRYRSKLEQKASLLLGVTWEYEACTMPYTMERKYTPDFTQGKLHVEVKGFFRPGDQAKYLAIRDSLPDEEELVFIFANPNKPVRKGAKLTHKKWCEKHGFRYYSINDCGDLNEETKKPPDNP